MKLRNIAKFEAKNPDVSVNVCGVQELKEKACKDDDNESESGLRKRGYIHPLRIASDTRIRHVNLLMTEKDGSFHYSTIRNFGVFF